MEVALTGGTGFVGRQLAGNLSAAGHRVRLLARTRPAQGTPPTHRDRANGVRPVPTDYADEHRLATDLAGADAVLHLVGIISECGEQTFKSVHDDLTVRLLRAARMAGVPRWIHMSALGTRPDARSRYHQTKWAAEEAVRASSLTWTLFRPSMIYGAGDQFTTLFARMAAVSPVLPVMGPGQNLLQPICVSQVARAFTGALQEPSSRHQVYDLCGPERLTFADVLRTILTVVGRRRWIVPIPWTLARLQAAGLEWIYPRVFRRPSPLNRDQILMLQEDNIGDGSAADALFGLRHESFRKAISTYLRR